MDHLLENKYSSYMVHVCGGSQISWSKSDRNSIHAAQWMSDLGEMSHTNRMKICDKVSVRMITHMAMQLHAMHYQCCLACSGHHFNELVICCLFVAIHKIVRESYVIQCCAFCDMCWSEQAARVQHFLFAHCLRALYLMSLVHLFDLSMSIWIWRLGSMCMMGLEPVMNLRARVWANDRIAHVLTNMHQTCCCICMTNFLRLLGLWFTLFCWGFCKVRQ